MDSYHQVRKALEDVRTAIQCVEYYVRPLYKVDVLEDLDDAETALIQALIKLEKLDGD